MRAFNTLVLTFLFVSTSLFAQHAYLWTENEGMQDLGTLGWPSSVAFGINRSRTVVGCAYDPSSPYLAHALIWTSTRGLRSMRGLTGNLRSCGLAINEHGQVAGYMNSIHSQTHAMVWTAQAGPVDLGVLRSTDNTSLANAINNFGQVVGYSTNSNGDVHAFLWTQAGGMQDLTTLFPKGCPICQEAFGISDSGVVVGEGKVPGSSVLYAFYLDLKTGMWKNLGSLDGDTVYGSVGVAFNSGRIAGTSALVAFVWSRAAGMQSLESMGGPPNQSYAWGMNSSEQIAGSYYVPPSSTVIHAFIWSPTDGMKDLGTLGGATSQGYAINGLGDVVGTADIH